MNPEKPLTGWKRWLFGASLPAAIALLLLYERLDGHSLKCAFYEITRLYCPGCGSGRAVSALLHGDLLQSFRYNPLLYLLGVPAFYCVVHEYIRILFPKSRLNAIVLPWSVCIGVLVLILAFWVLRNLPVFSFLAPGI